MHATIRQWPSDYFYDGKLVDAAEALGRGRVDGIRWPGDHAFAFVNVAGEKSRQCTTDSVANVSEAKAVVTCLKGVMATGSSRAVDIGVLSIAQVNRIRELLVEEGIPVATKRSTGVVVGSVDKFQGDEKELILMSAVRSNSRADVKRSGGGCDKGWGQT